MPSTRNCSVCVWGLLSCLCGGRLLPHHLPDHQAGQGASQLESFPSSYLLEQEVLEQCWAWCTWHCTIQMSAGTGRITRSLEQAGSQRTSSTQYIWATANWKKDAPPHTHLNHQVLYRAAYGQGLFRSHPHTVLHLTRKCFSSQCMKSCWFGGVYYTYQ